MIEIPVSFGEWVQKRRKQLDLTRNDLAAKVGCSPVTIKKIERDERKPSKQIAELLATFLEIETERYDLFVQKARGSFVEEGSLARAQTAKEGWEVATDDKQSKLNNLPDQMGQIIGRESEISLLTDIIKDPSQRLISLIGTGGMGKSRLAIHLGQTLQKSIEDGGQEFSNGIFYIDFNAHKDQSHIVSAIAKSTGVEIKKERRLPKDQLFDWLRLKRLLLIFDNFDHLIDHAAIIPELLEAASGLKILVTSRERLNLQQEQVFPMQGLAFPENTEQDDIESYPAVKLFLEIAHRVQPEFAFTAENSEPIVRLCQIVEGMPLSLELAAAWIDLLSAAEIVDEIKNSLDFLETGLRDFPERHRSMRAVFDASWEKLGSNEKKTFSRLSIFQGRFSRRAARSVAGAGLNVLARLVDRSLIWYDSNLEYYQINELLTQYAAGKLEELESAESRNDLLERHSVYYLEALAERSDLIKGDGQQVVGLTIAGQKTTGQKTTGQKTALDQMNRDIKNIRFAWRWAVDHFKQDLIFTGMEPLANFLDFKGRYHEGEKTFSFFTETLKGQCKQPEEKRLLLSGYAWLSVFEFARGKMKEAWTSVDSATRIVEELSKLGIDVDREQAFVAVLTGQLKAINRLDDAIPFYLEALELYRKHNMGWEQAALMTTLGSAARLQGDYLKANSWLEDSLKIRQRIGDEIGAAETMSSMSELSRYRGQFFEATILAQSSVELARQINNENVLAFGLVNLGMSYYYVGEFAKQHRYLMESLAIYQSLNNTNRVPDIYYRLSLANVSLGQYETGATNAQLGLNLARHTGNKVQMANLFYAQGVASLAARSFDSGKQLLTDSLAIFPEIGQKTHRKSGIITLIGFAEYNLGNPTPAKRYFHQALNSAIEMHDQIALILIFGISALVLADKNLNKEATVLWKMVKRLSPPFQNAEWLKAFYGDRLTEVENQLSQADLTWIEEHIQKNNILDEAETLLVFMNKEGWGKGRPEKLD
ncbi:MAG: putative ATPase/transcriptional regulator with XRE-family HTH domain [Cellvibrionaceae bacterium]|jgi:predicted ATPase/transcriptional regulator with XRE-family HTH domain